MYKLNDNFPRENQR